MASAESTSAEFEDSDVIEILSAEEYDSHRAKLRASISWILTKAYGVNIPPQIKEPFYENAKGQLQLKPQLVNLLVSSDLYCQACSNMFTDTSSQWQGHWSIIQVLSRKGIYVTESAEAVVTETVLMQTAPFKVAAHLALIDALMKAYASEIASVERVVQAVRRYASFNASSELPCGTEEALMFWVNKTCTALASRGDLESEIIQGESSQKVRIISKSTPREPRSIPKMEELLRDVGDGCCLAGVIAFYQPDSFPMKDVCLKESLGIADSLYNLRLLRTYCERHLVLKCFHFTYEDLLYARDNLHPNLLVFVAELFFLLEAMQGRDSSVGHKEGAGEGVGQVGGRRLPSPSMPQISSATKRSFQKAAAEEGRHQTDKFGTSPSSLSSRQPLLPRRTPGRRSNSLSSPQERDTVRRSVLAWQDDQDLRERKSQASTLLENVSMSWEADTTDPELEAVTSTDLAEFESTGPHLMDPHHPDYMELVSVTPSSPRSTPKSMLAERLMPATLRPAKEKANNHSKAEERGDRALRKKPATSPTTPKANSKGKLSPPGSVMRGRTSPGVGTGSVGSGGGEGRQQRSSGSSSSMDETIVTPLGSADLLTARSGGESSPVPSQREVQSGQSATVTARVPPSEAFMVQPDAADLPLQLPHSPRRTVSGAGVHGDRPTPTTSYTLESTIHDARSARDAGLPIIGRTASDLPTDVEIGVRLGGAVGASREGSVASSRSSGDFSDHESHKIHQDHKARESLKHSPRRLGDVGEKVALLQPRVDGSKPGPLIMDQLPDGGQKPGTTSFAELRRMKEGFGNMDNSGYIYMQHGMEPSQGGGSDPQRVGPGGAVVKKATFRQLPNETTWRQSTQRTAAGASPPTGSSNGGGGGDDSSLNPSQFSQLKLKLEEKRREIERNKQRQEMATAKMRQRMGKLAFMRVISKQDDSSAGIVSALSTQPALLGSGIVGSVDISNNSSVGGGLTGATLQDRLDHVPRPTTLSTRSNSSSTSTSASQSPSGAAAAASTAGRPFSREGIQQTIDGVRRRWFHGSDPEGDLIRATCQAVDEAETDGVPVSQLSNDMMQSCPPMMAAAAFGYAPRPGSAMGQEGPRHSPSLLEQSRRLSETDGILGTSASPAVPSHRQVRELSQSPRPSGSPERRSSSFSGEQEEYDQSLDKLNKSLTELQGEIKRLSLQQQEQFRVANPTVTGLESEQQQLPSYPPLAAAPQPQQFTQQQSPLLPSHHGTRRTVIGPVVRTASHSHQPALPDPFSSPSLIPTVQPSPPPPASLADLPPAYGDGAEGVASQDDDSSSGNGGFFVVFGDESTPRRPRPKLGKEREGAGVIRKDSGGDERVPPTLGGGMVQASAWAGSGELSSNHSGSHHSLGSDDSSQAATYVLGQEAGPDGQGLQETEMQKKKKRLIEQQQKRKEEQERKRIEKEMEVQCKLEQKMQKEEEQARKKAEDKARKEAIFQQYMQKKMDGDEDKSPVSGPVTRRDRSAHGGQQRPKSMFVKNRPVVADVPDGAAANHSSQEDLARLKSPPSGAALSPFRLNPNSRGNIRKAVSTSQLAQNGGQGATTYRRPPSPGQGRRPPSPDVRFRRSGSRSRDSGSDTASQCSSNIAEYTGPKLFVKPSAKSNRHIIINALSYCCLAGIVNNDLKNKVLEEIARSTAKHFLILFRDHGCQYRGLYSFDPDSEEAYKITGVGPRLLASDMVEKFYKYNSGGKSFTEVTSTKHLSVSLDAIVLMNTFWKTKPTSSTAANVKK